MNGSYSFQQEIERDNDEDHEDSFFNQATSPEMSDAESLRLWYWIEERHTLMVHHVDQNVADGTYKEA